MLEMFSESFDNFFTVLDSYMDGHKFLLCPLSIVFLVFSVGSDISMELFSSIADMLLKGSETTVDSPIADITLMLPRQDQM